MQRIKTQKLDIKASPKFVFEMLNFLGIKACPQSSFMLIGEQIFLKRQHCSILSDTSSPMPEIVRFEGVIYSYLVYKGSLYFI